MEAKIKQLHAKLTGMTAQELADYITIIESLIPFIIMGLKLAKIFTNSKVDAIIDEIIDILKDHA